MSCRVIISQGRLGDRTSGAIPGALALGRALSEHLGGTPRVVGAPPVTASATAGSGSARLDDYESALAEGDGTLRALAVAVAADLDAGFTPIIAGNKCPVALATVPVAAATNPDLVVVWFDAHGDFNTPVSSDSSYLGGMVLSAVCGVWDSGHGAGVDPRNVVVVGARDLDDAERELLERAGVTIMPPLELDHARLSDFVAGRPVWIHVDLDVLEPGFVPLDYEVPGGLSPDDLVACMAVLAREHVVGLEVTEFEAPDADMAPDTEQAVLNVTRMLEPLLSGS